MKDIHSSKSVLLTSLITVLVGLIMVFFPVSVTNFLDYIVGGALILIGVFSIAIYIRYGSSSLAFGIIMILIGAYFLYDTGVVLKIAAFVFGLFILINGIFGFQFSLEAKKMDIPRWKFSMFFSVVNGVLGLIILINPFETTLILITYIGIFMIVSGVLNMFSLVINRR